MFSERNQIVERMCHDPVMLSLRARQLYAAACAAVKPETLVRQCLSIKRDPGGSTHISIHQPHKTRTSTTHQQIEVPTGGKICVVSFGKAAVGMTAAACGALQREGVEWHRAVVSCPHGTGWIDGDGIENVQLHPGARNNLPDLAAAAAAEKIEAVAAELKGEDDLLLVLVSGGGSALLPAPVPPVTLAEKCHCIKMLSLAGANISELNVVRQNLSRLKGGRLAQLAEPAQVLSLIFSDLLENELEFVASGPTVPQKSTAHDAWCVLEKFKIMNKVAPSILDHLKLQISNPCLHDIQNFDRVHNVLIGDIRIALESGAKSLDAFDVSIIRHNVVGEASVVGRCYAELVAAIMDKSGRHTVSEQMKHAVFPCDSTLENLMLRIKGTPGSGSGHRKILSSFRWRAHSHSRPSIG